MGPRHVPHILRNLKILEVSSVDRGAGEGVRIVLMKRDDAKKPVVFHDVNAEIDLDAITVKAAEIDLSAIEVEKAKEIDAMSLDELNKIIAKQVSDAIASAMTAVTESVGKVVTSAVDAAVTKAFPPAKDPKKKPGDGPAADENCDDDETKKALAVAALPPSVRKVFDEAEKNAGLVTKFMADRELEEFSKRAMALGLKKEDGVLMQKAYTGDKASQKVWEERLATVAKAAAGMEKTAVIFSEFGDNRGGREGADVSAYDQLMDLAKDLRKKDASLTEAQAFTKVVTDPANRELASQERDQRMSKIHRVNQ